MRRIQEEGLSVSGERVVGSLVDSLFGMWLGSTYICNMKESCRCLVRCESEGEGSVCRRYFNAQVNERVLVTDRGQWEIGGESYIGRATSSR